MTLLISIVSLLLAFGEDVKEKQYQKKYILILYFILFFGIVIIKMDYIILSLSFLLITLLSGINSAYLSDEIEIEQGRINLIIYKVLHWIYTTKLYIFYICIIIMWCLHYFYKADNIFVQMLIIIFFLAYHLSSNIIDKFGVHSFSNTYDILIKNAKVFDYLYDEASRDKKEEIYKYLAFLVYMEDKDYFSRKTFTFSLISILKRKVNNKFVTKLKAPVSSKNLLRGYSTIEQQFIRKNSMVKDTYHYGIRRKFFVELQYTKYFSRALIPYIKRVKYTYKKESRNYIKVLILKWYYIKVLKCPESINEYFNNFQSKKGIPYQFFWEQFLLYGQDYERVINKNFERANRIVKEERI